MRVFVYIKPPSNDWAKAVYSFLESKKPNTRLEYIKSWTKVNAIIRNWSNSLIFHDQIAIDHLDPHPCHSSTHLLAKFARYGLHELKIHKYSSYLFVFTWDLCFANSCDTVYSFMDEKL